MKKALCDLTFIIADLDRAIFKCGKGVMPRKELSKLRALRHIRADLSETLRVYRLEFKNF